MKNSVNAILENLNESRKLNEYAEVNAHGGIEKVINDALRKSNAKNFIKVLANATFDYCHEEDEDGELVDHHDQRRHREVEDFWFSLSKAIESAQNGYF